MTYKLKKRTKKGSTNEMKHGVNLAAPFVGMKKEESIEYPFAKQVRSGRLEPVLLFAPKHAGLCSELRARICRFVWAMVPSAVFLLTTCLSTACSSQTDGNHQDSSVLGGTTVALE